MREKKISHSSSVSLRLVVVGSTGSGKTTLARRIAHQLSLPHVELDSFYWESNWQAATRAVFRERVLAATSGNAWIVDGNYSQSRDIVWPRATHLVWLDYNLALVMGRVLRRTASRLLSQRELWNGNRESLRSILSRDSIILYAYTSHRRNRKRFSALSASEEAKHLKIYRIKRPEEASLWLQVIRSSQFSGASMTTPNHLPSVESVAEALRTKAYIADHSLATAIFLALKLKRPLFLEGEGRGRQD